MVYVQRNNTGAIVGLYNQPQPGYAEEELADDHPYVVEYRSRLEPTIDDLIDIERDRRVNAGLSFMGHRFQTRPQDRENIAGAATLALVALTLHGATVGDLRWHGGQSDFAWIDADNNLVPLDAPTMVMLGASAANHKADHIYAARRLKDEPPLDFTDDVHWP